MIERTAQLSVSRQAILLGISRGSIYWAPRRIDHLSEDDGLNAAFTGSRPGPAGFYGDFPRSNGAISASRSSPDDLLPQFGHAVVAARRSSCTSRRML